MGCTCTLVQGICMSERELCRVSGLLVQAVMDARPTAGRTDLQYPTGTYGPLVNKRLPEYMKYMCAKTGSYTGQTRCVHCIACNVWDIHHRQVWRKRGRVWIAVLGSHCAMLANA